LLGRARGLHLFLLLPLAVVQELKRKGPGYKRDISFWGQVGEGAISLGCVAAVCFLTRPRSQVAPCSAGTVLLKIRSHSASHCQS